MTAYRMLEAESNVDAATPQVTDNMMLEALTLALLRLFCWHEDKGEFSFWRAWKGYDFKTLDCLQEQGLIAFRRANKSVELTDKGFLQTRAFFSTTPLPRRFVPRWRRLSQNSKVLGALRRTT